MRVLAMSALVCALVPGLSATVEARSLHNKLQSCLELKDMTKQRLDCYDAILPPQQQPNPMPPRAKVVTDCRFSKDENERLICFNEFAEKPAKPAAPKATSAAPKPVEPTAIVPSAGTTGAHTRQESTPIDGRTIVVCLILKRYLSAERAVPEAPM
jgi:hypothetical protein